MADMYTGECHDYIEIMKKVLASKEKDPRKTIERGTMLPPPNGYRMSSKEQQHTSQLCQ